MRVSNPPPKPLLIWNGECHFCRRWVKRWDETTGGAVDYIPFQEIGDRFGEIPLPEFERAATLIERDGAVYSGAQAVFRALRFRSSQGDRDAVALPESRVRSMNGRQDDCS